MIYCILLIIRSEHLLLFHIFTLISQKMFMVTSVYSFHGIHVQNSPKRESFSLRIISNILYHLVQNNRDRSRIF